MEKVSITIRLPRDLKERAKDIAQKRGLSLNAFFTKFIESEIRSEEHLKALSAEDWGNPIFDGHPVLDGPEYRDLRVQARRRKFTIVSSK